MACGWYGIARTAAMDRAAVWVELDDGGTVKVATGVTEIGEGVLTGLCQIAAQEMGVRPEDIVLGDNDTARVPEAAHAGATRMTLTPEFGPAPYTPALPRSGELVSDPWQQNVAMLALLRQRYGRRQ